MLYIVFFSLLASLLPCGLSQAQEGTALQELVLSWAEADLFENITNYPEQPEIESKYHPNKYQLPLDDYAWAPPSPDEFSVNVIFDPCRGYGFDCCNNTFGTPEWEVIVADPEAVAPFEYGKRTIVYSDGTEVPKGVSRFPPSTLRIDETCEDYLEPRIAKKTSSGSVGRIDCLMKRVARGPPLMFPRCWNWNTSIIAGDGCRDPVDGSPLPLCVELGFTSTVHIIQCGGKFHDDPHCGTFLEVHRPDRAEVLSEVRLPRIDPSGYRMTVMPTTYKADDTRVLCWDPYLRGQYEIWWVLRTRYNFIAQRRVPFAVISPLCDWNDLLGRFEPFATLKTAKILAKINNKGFDPRETVFTLPLQWATLVDKNGKTIQRETVLLDPFKDSSRLFTQPRTQGKARSSPGKGMGGTFSSSSPNSFDQVGVDVTGGTRKYSPDLSQAFDPMLWGNNYTYTFTPTVPSYDVKTGSVTPSDDQYLKIVQTIEQRGYSRRVSATP